MNAPVDSPVARALEEGFQLGTLMIDPRSGEAGGPGGREKLDPKVMDVLVMLAHRAGQVVPREDLLAQLWPNVVVTDEALSRCIYELRRQLSLAGGHERYKELIETIPKRGYRLAGDVTIAPVLSSSRPAPRQKWHSLALGAAAVAAVTLATVLNLRTVYSPSDSRILPAAPVTASIAVLPFADMSEEHDLGYLSDGIAEEILNHLAQSNQLRVIARTSSFALRDQALDVAEIARKLDVTHVLEGSVRKVGDRVRVTAQLILASDSSHMWSNSFDRGLSDVFSVQEEIATSVARALRVSLGAGSPNEPMPASVAAHESFLRGRFFYYRRAPGDVERSVVYFKEALAIDPDYARAWAALAGAYSLLAWNGLEVDQELQRLQGEAALRAVELDPRLAIAHIRLGQFYDGTIDRRKAEEHNRIARALDPDDPMVLGDMSTRAFEAGDIDRAIAIQREIVNRDPLNPVNRQNLAVKLLAGDQFDEALSEYQSVLELNPDAGPDVEIELVRIGILQGRDAEVHAAVTKMPAGKYRDHGLALLYRVPAHRVEADAALARLAAQQGATTEGIGADIMDEIRLAEVRAFRGMPEAAFHTLSEKKAALARKWGKESIVVWYFQYEAKVSPFLKRLHEDPRWSIFISAAP